jgi:hypothetical protein
MINVSARTSMGLAILQASAPVKAELQLETAPRGELEAFRLKAYVIDQYWNCHNCMWQHTFICLCSFGVCCVFTLSTTGTVTQNCTYIQNPGYPSIYSSTSGVTYTVNKCSSGKLKMFTFKTMEMSLIVLK